MPKAKGKSKKRKIAGSPGAISTQVGSDTLLHSCAQCNLRIEDECDFVALKCSICTSYFHDECLSFDAEVTDALKSIVEDVGWSCRPCLIRAREQLRAPAPSAANPMMPDPSVARLDNDIGELRGYCSDLRADISSLKDALNWMSREDKTATKQGDSSKTSHYNSQAPQRPSYASCITAASVAHVPSSSKHQTEILDPVLNKEDMLRAVYTEIGDKDRRRRNIVVSNVAPDREYNDVALFVALARHHLKLDAGLNIDSEIAAEHCRRLGKRIPGKTQLLLIVMKREEVADHILNHARDLRYSSDDFVMQNIYINSDLTPIEAKLSFDLREEKRARRANFSTSSSQKPQQLTHHLSYPTLHESMISDAPQVSLITGALVVDPSVTPAISDPADVIAADVTAPATA